MGSKVIKKGKNKKTHQLVRTNLSNESVRLLLSRKLGEELALLSSNTQLDKDTIDR